MDAVLDTLRTARLTGGIFLEAEFTAPWCVLAGVGPEDCQPFLTEQPRSIIAYHYVSAGRLVLEVDGEAPMTVEGGEIVVLPRNDEHRLGSATGLRPIAADSLIQPGENGGLARIVHGGGGERTRIVCGFLASDVPNDPLLGVLPRVLKLGVADGASGQWIESTFRFAAEELAADHVRSPGMLAKLAELLFHEAVRRYLAALPAEERRFVDGLGDPLVARTLALMQSRPGHPWTAEALAREAGLSRSAFAARFTALLGEPPMRYLARARLQEASRRLAETGDPVARIAFAAGYESEAAFNRAFKRAFGLPPAAGRGNARGLAERPHGGGGFLRARHHLEERRLPILGRTLRP